MRIIRADTLRGGLRDCFAGIRGPELLLLTAMPLQSPFSPAVVVEGSGPRHFSPAYVVFLALPPKSQRLARQLLQEVDETLRDVTRAQTSVTHTKIVQGLVTLQGPEFSGAGGSEWVDAALDTIAKFDDYNSAGDSEQEELWPDALEAFQGCLGSGISLGVPLELILALQAHCFRPSPLIDRDLLSNLMISRAVGEMAVDADVSHGPFALGAERWKDKNPASVLARSQLAWATSVLEYAPAKYQKGLRWIVNCWFADLAEAAALRCNTHELLTSMLRYRRAMASFVLSNESLDRKPGDKLILADPRRCEPVSEPVAKILNKMLGELDVDLQPHLHPYLNLGSPKRFVIKHAEGKYFPDEAITPSVMCERLRTWFRSAVEEDAPDVEKSIRDLQTRRLTSYFARFLTLIELYVQDENHAAWLRGMMILALRSAPTYDDQLGCLALGILWASNLPALGPRTQQRELLPFLLHIIPRANLNYILHSVLPNAKAASPRKRGTDLRKGASNPQQLHSLFSELSSGLTKGPLPRFADFLKSAPVLPDEAQLLMNRALTLARGEETVKRIDAALEMLDRELLRHCIATVEADCTPEEFFMGFGHAVEDAYTCWKTLCSPDGGTYCARPAKMSHNPETAHGSDPHVAHERENCKLQENRDPTRLLRPSKPKVDASMFDEPMMDKDIYETFCSVDLKGLSFWQRWLGVSVEYMNTLRRALTKSRKNADTPELRTRHRDIVLETLCDLMCSRFEPSEKPDCPGLRTFLSDEEVETLLSDLKRLEGGKPLASPPVEDQIEAVLLGRLGGVLDSIDTEGLVRGSLKNSAYTERMKSFCEPARTCILLVSGLRRKLLGYQSMKPAARRRRDCDTYLNGVELCNQWLHMQKMIDDDEWKAFTFLSFLNAAVCNDFDSFCVWGCSQELGTQLAEVNPLKINSFFLEGPLGCQLALWHAQKTGRMGCILLDKNGEPNLSRRLAKHLRITQWLAIDKAGAQFEQMKKDDFLALGRESAVAKVAGAMRVPDLRESPIFHSFIGNLLRGKKEASKETSTAGKSSEKMSEAQHPLQLLEECAYDGLDEKSRWIATRITKAIEVREVDQGQVRMEDDVYTAGQLLIWLIGLKEAARNKRDLEKYLAHVRQCVNTPGETHILGNLQKISAAKVADEAWQHFCTAQRLCIDNAKPNAHKAPPTPINIIKAMHTIHLPEEITSRLLKERRRFHPVFECGASDVQKVFEYFRTGGGGPNETLALAAWYKKVIFSLSQVNRQLEKLPAGGEDHGTWLWAALFFDLEDMLVQGIAGSQLEQLQARYLAAFDHVLRGRGLLNPRCHTHSSSLVEKGIERMQKKYDPDGAIPKFQPYMLLGLEDARMDAYKGADILSESEKEWIRTQTLQVDGLTQYVTCLSSFLTLHLHPAEPYEAGNEEEERHIAYNLTLFLMELDLYLQDVDFKFYTQAVLLKSLRKSRNSTERIMCIEKACEWLQSEVLHVEKKVKDPWARDLTLYLPGGEIDQAAFKYCPSPLSRRRAPPPEAQKRHDLQLGRTACDLNKKPGFKVNQRWEVADEPRPTIRVPKAKKGGNKRTKRASSEAGMSGQRERSIHTLLDWDALTFLEILRRLHPRMTEEDESLLINLASRYRIRETLTESFLDWLESNEDFKEFARRMTEAGEEGAWLEECRESQRQWQSQAFYKVVTDLKSKGAAEDTPMERKRFQSLETLEQVFRSETENGRRTYPIRNLEDSSRSRKHPLNGKGKEEKGGRGTGGGEEDEDGGAKYLAALPAKIAKYCKGIWPTVADLELQKFLVDHLSDLRKLEKADARHQTLLALETCLGYLTVTHMEAERPSNRPHGCFLEPKDILLSFSSQLKLFHERLNLAPPRFPATWITFGYSNSH